MTFRSPESRLPFTITDLTYLTVSDLSDKDARDDELVTVIHVEPAVAASVMWRFAAACAAGAPPGVSWPLGRDVSVSPGAPRR